MELMAVKKKSETMSTLPLRVISVLLAVAVGILLKGVSENQSKQQKYVKGNNTKELLTFSINVAMKE
jgi:hypothetical protein